MSSPYPTAYQIEEMFSNRVDTDIFNTYFADNPEILMVGDDFHLGGRHSSVQSWHDSIYGRVTAAVKIETLRNEVLRVIGGGESPWAAVESVTTATTNSERSFFDEDKPYSNLHVDLVRFNSQGKIAHLREFFDTQHVHGHMEEHHGKK